MSRTTRAQITEKNYREVRKGKADVDAWAMSYGPYRTPKHGGMAMSSRSCGFWGDEYNPTDRSRKATKRNVKRRERRNAMREHLASF